MAKPRGSARAGPASGEIWPCDGACPARRSMGERPHHGTSQPHVAGTGDAWAKARNTRCLVPADCLLRAGRPKRGVMDMVSHAARSAHPFDLYAGRVRWPDRARAGRVGTKAKSPGEGQIHLRVLDVIPLTTEHGTRGSLLRCHQNCDLPVKISITRHVEAQGSNGWRCPRE